MEERAKKDEEATGKLAAEAVQAAKEIDELKAELTKLQS
jgi:hypothetical protein